MSDSQQAAAPESGQTPENELTASPSSSVPRTDCAGDPEIEALLDFEPVPRKRDVEGAWTPQLQRVFIARLAVHGSATKACDEMGKNQTGIMKLYRSPEGASFRASWDAAVDLAKRRKAETLQYVSPGTRPPTIDNRRKHQWIEPAGLPPSPGSGRGLDEQVDEAGQMELLHTIGLKFMRKVAAEREARLNGEIVAADFYLRQVTMMEVLLDLASCEFGFDPHDVLHELRRGEHNILDIAATPLSDWIDRSRRLWWSQEGEPERPPHPDVRFLERHRSHEGDYATQFDQYTYGRMTRPARGYSPEEWAEMEFEQQVEARQAQFDQDAEEQREWELRAIAEHSERTRSDK